MTRSLKPVVRISLALTATLCATPVLAHPEGHHAAASLMTGFAHPFSGLDHLLAFGAIGLWAAQYRRPTAWMLPLLFLVVMVLSAILGFAGMALPGVEAGIAASLVVLGLLLALALKLPLWVSALLVTVFASFHGHAHGTELPAGASAALYGVGFIAATALLHLGGMAATRGVVHRIMPAIGTAIAAAGVYLLAI